MIPSETEGRGGRRQVDMLRCFTSDPYLFGRIAAVQPRLLTYGEDW